MGKSNIHPKIIKNGKAKLVTLQKGQRKTPELGRQIEAEVESKYRSLQATDQTVKVPKDLCLCAPHWGTMENHITSLVSTYKPGSTYLEATRLRERED